MMLLQNGELYQWRDDNPLPVLMNQMFVKDYDPNSLVEKLNASRFYWTEEELLSLDRQGIVTLRVEMNVVIHHRGDHCAYYRHDYERSDAKKYTKITALDLETKTKADLQNLATELGLLDHVSIQHIVKAIIAKRANMTTLIHDIAAGAFHFLATTSLSSLPLWSWGKTLTGNWESMMRWIGSIHAQWSESLAK